MSNLSKTDILSLDYGGKAIMLEKVGQEILNLSVDYGQVAGRYAELRAQLEVLKQIKSVLQSALKAERPEGGTNSGEKIIKNPTYNKRKTTNITSKRT